MELILRSAIRRAAWSRSVQSQEITVLLTSALWVLADHPLVEALVSRLIAGPMASSLFEVRSLIPCWIRRVFPVWRGWATAPESSTWWRPLGRWMPHSKRRCKGSASPRLSSAVADPDRP